MLATTLQTRLSPFSLLVNSSAISASYRALQLSPGRVRGCSMFGSMEVAVDTGLESEVAVDGDAFLQILRSLPAGELKMVSSGTSLSWSCGAAKGQLALMGEDTRVTPPEWPSKIAWEQVEPTFGRALEMGAMACGTSALMSVGLYGVSIVPGGGAVRAYSSDNDTIASACLCQRDGAIGSATLSPMSARLLAVVASRDMASVAVDDTTLYCETADTRLALKQVPPLKFSIPEMLAAYLPEDVKVPLNRDVVSSFIRRAEALTEEKKRTDVSISVVEGAVKLSFLDGKSSSEEYYLAEGNKEASVDPILVDSRRLSVALSRSSRVVFDHADRGALVLRGDSDFVFVLSGKAPA